MEPETKTVELRYGDERIQLTLDFEGGKYATTVRLNGVSCHLEAMPVGRLLKDYRLDDDPDYHPTADDDGHGFLLVPFAE